MTCCHYMSVTAVISHGLWCQLVNQFQTIGGTRLLWLQMSARIILTFSFCTEKLPNISTQTSHNSHNKPLHGAAFTHRHLHTQKLDETCTARRSKAPPRCPPTSEVVLPGLGSSGSDG